MSDSVAPTHEGGSTIGASKGELRAELYDSKLPGSEEEAKRRYLEHNQRVAEELRQLNLYPEGDINAFSSNQRCPSTPELLMTSGYFILNTDGGMVSTGRRSDDDPPGKAAIAVVLKKTKKGRKTEAVVESFGRTIGAKMNDQAEYEALLEGLRTAIKHGATHVRAFMDSEFVVES